MNPNYEESKKYWRVPRDPPKVKIGSPFNGIEEALLNFVLEKAEKGNPQDVINKIDEFCEKNWMMNVGPEKGKIIKEQMSKHPIKKVLEAGGYCGYSALVYANQISSREGAKVHTIEINEYYAGIARKIQEYAGLAHLIDIHLATIEQSENYIKQNGPYDMIFFDHMGKLFVADIERLQKYGVIGKGCIVVGDNIIRPGCPDYLERMKNHAEYKSTLYHSYIEYSDLPDAVLVSQKI